MILERRDILFDFPTAIEVIRESGTRWGKMAEFHEYFRIKEVHRISAVKRSRDLTNRVARIQLSGDFEMRHDDDIVIIVISRDFKEAAIFIPEPELVDIFSNGCIKRDIRLPREAEKSIQTEDLLVGLRVLPNTPHSVGLSLE